jgi:hypothetical protein
MGGAVVLNRPAFEFISDLCRRRRRLERFRRFRVVRFKEGLQIRGACADFANDAVFVDQQGDGHGGDFESIEGVGEDGPIHLLPLHEQAATIGMLFLDDSGHANLAGFLKIFGEVVPPGHVSSTARSPGRKNVQNGFVSLKVGDGFRDSVEIGECQRGKGLAGFELCGGGGGGGRHESDGNEPG